LHTVTTEQLQHYTCAI